MEVGGAVMEFKVGQDGSVTRFRFELTRFFTRGFYKRFIKSDARILKGKLELTA